MARRSRMTSLERRAQLIEVGRAAFAKYGYERTSVEEIAKRAKVSKPLIYEHFGGKEGLYAVIVDREVNYVERRILEAIGRGTPRERLERAALAFLTYVKDQPEGFAILSQSTPHSGGSKESASSSLMNEMAARVGDLFVSMLKSAGYDPRAAPIYANALVGLVTFVAQWWTRNPKMPIEDVAKHLVALTWMGLRHLPKKPSLSGERAK